MVTTQLILLRSENGISVAGLRTRKDFEVTGGLRLEQYLFRPQLQPIGYTTSTSGVYTTSTFTGVAGTTEFEGVGATFDVVIDGSAECVICYSQ